MDEPADGLEVRVWESEPNLGRWMAWPVHEFMIIVEGEVVMIEDDRETVVGPGESFFIPKGRRCVWNQSSDAKKFFMIFDDKSGLSADASSPIFKLDPLRVRRYFEDPSGQLQVGVRETTDPRGDVMPAASHQMIHVLEGDIGVTDEQGGTQTFSAGDTCFVPRGARVSWESDGSVRAVYCTLTPHPRV
jgi:uncharacterized cupin superfamily protein